MKTKRPQVVRDWQGLDHVQTRNVCGNTTYVRNYEAEYALFLAGMRLFNAYTFFITRSYKAERYSHGELYDIPSEVLYKGLVSGICLQSINTDDNRSGAVRP